MTIDSLTIYCLATGKPIAAIEDDEAGFIIDSVAATVPLAAQAAHFERLALSSMRPSMPWLNVTPAMIDYMREAHPTQLLAYLMNRLYTHVDLDRKTGKPLNPESWLNARRMRIAMWQSIESASLSAERLNAILYVLLRIDSRYSLTKINAPIAVSTSFDSWHTDVDAFVKSLWTWNGGLEDQEAKDLKRAKFQAEFWSEGNRLTRKALAEQFQRVTPPSRNVAEKRAKTHKLAEGVSFLDQLERELTSRTRMADPAALPVQTAPASGVKPGKKIMRFGVKNVEA